jgi:hypothetical protein
MARIEVEESDLAQFHKIRDTLAKINADPEGKKLLQRAHKKIDPHAITPDIDEEEQKLALKTELEKKIEELEAKYRTDKEEADKEKSLSSLNAKFEAGRKALKDQRYTDEGIEAVEKFMNERGIPDHLVAAAYLEKQNPPQEIMSPRAFGGFNFLEQPKDGEDKFLKALLDSKGENDGAVLSAAIDAVGELRSTRR